MIIRLLLTFFISLHSCHVFSQVEHLSSDAQLEDLKFLKEQLEEFHPGLYRYTTKDSIDLIFAQVEKELSEGSVLEFYTKVNWLLSKVKCGHTRGGLPANVATSFQNQEKYIPFSVKILGKGLVVDQVFQEGVSLQKGEQILSINQMSVSQLKEHVFSYLSADGFITSGKERQFESYFNYYYPLYVKKDVVNFAIKVMGHDGKTREISVDGIDWKTLVSKHFSRPGESLLSLTINPDHALMKIKTFDSGDISRAGQNYYNFLESSFETIGDSGVENLILDLRGNGGGDDDYGATLVAYLAKNRFRYFDRIEVTDSYSGYGRVRKDGGANLMTSHKGLDYWQPKENRFEGKVYVLTDGWSFSTCADVATVLHYNGWATFIGEETGGGYDGNTSGNSKSLTLPNSKVRVNLPMWKYTTANRGHSFYGRGVKPDYKMEPSISEFISGQDAAMNKALDLIKRD